MILSTNTNHEHYLIRAVLLIAVIALFPWVGEAAITLTVDFTKIKSTESVSDTVKGNLYWFKNRMTIRITAPITQFMLIDSLQTLIYNPSEHAGIQLSGKTMSFLLFFHTFIGFFKGDQVVPQVNFKIKASVKKGDSLYTEWIPQGNRNSFKGKFETVYCNDLPVRATTYDKKGTLLYRMTFGHDTLINGAHIPLRISTLTPKRSGSMLEDVEFRNVLVNKPIPAEIAKFKIPSEIPIKVLGW